VRVVAQAPAAETPAGDDRGKKISHKRGRSLSSLVPRLIGRRTSATGDELNVSSSLHNWMTKMWTWSWHAWRSTCKAYSSACWARVMPRTGAERF